jgi:phenylacetate-CoA ligase
MSPPPAGPPVRFHPASSPDYVPLHYLRELQSRRLRRVVGRAYDAVPLYRRRLDDLGLKPDDIRSIDDVARLPFTVKTDLGEAYPAEMFAVPTERIARLQPSSAAAGKPIVVAYTRRDLDVWREVMARTLAAVGLDEGDVIQNAFGHGLFTGGLGLHYGAEALRATVLPASGATIDRQITLMNDLGVSAIGCTPSYFLHILTRAEQIGVDLRGLPLRVGVFGAEPWTEAMRQRIETAAGIRACDVYGLGEIVGPGVASECTGQDGLHVFEDHFYPEIIDPETNLPAPEGAEGELVLTTLTKEAMPLLRYRTRDVTRFLPGRSPSGRTLRRIARIAHRTDDMFIVRGVKVFPAQIETALLNVEGTLPHYRIVLTRSEGLDQMNVEVEVTREILSDRVGALETLRQRIAREIEQALGLGAGVTLAEPLSLQRSEGKAARVIDRREG